MRKERDQAISLISTFAKERTHVQAHMAAQSRSSENRAGSLYEKVGLAHDCPDFLLKAAQFAFRKEYHPDLHPMYQRGEAEQRFKESEAVFEEIKRLRGA